MTGIAPVRLLDNVVAECKVRCTSLELDPARVEHIVKLDALQKVMDLMHKETEISVSTRRKRTIDAHNKATNQQQPNFSVGDLVLVRRRDKVSYKLQFKWCGPRRIIATASHLVYIVK